MANVQVPSNVQVPVQAKAGGSYRPLPALVPVTQQDDETGPEYAARVLRFLLIHRCGVVLTDQQLEQAWQASQRAIIATQDQGVISQLYSIRQLITTTQRHRRGLQDAPAEAASAPYSPDPPQGGSQGGRPAVLLPQPPPRLPPSHAAGVPSRQELQGVW